MSTPPPIVKNGATQEEDAAARSSVDQAPPPLSRSVGAGMLWMLITTGVGRVASVIAQYFLAYLLVQSEWGIAAIGISVAALLQTVRDGGCRRLLIQRGIDEYDELAGPTFWMATAFNISICVILIILAPLIATMYQQPILLEMLTVSAITIPLSTPGLMLLAKCNIDLNFRPVAKTESVAQIIRHGGVVLFALFEFGPMSFVAPLPFVAIYQSAAAYYYTRQRPWERPARINTWTRMFATTKWITLGTFATSAYNLGPMAFTGLIVPEAILGVYFFAYQLTKQIINLLMMNLQNVMVPALTRLKNEPKRRRAASIRSIRLLTFLSAPASFGLAAIMAPLIETLWSNHRWSAAIVPGVILSVFLPLNVLNAVPRSVLQAVGRFSLWSKLLLLDAVGVIIAAVLGAYFLENAVGIALFVGIYTGVASITFSAIALRVIGVSLGALLRNIATPLALGAALSAISIAIDLVALEHASPRARLVIIGGFFAAAYTLIVRAAFHDDLEGIVNALPRQLRGPLSRLLRIRQDSATTPLLAVEQLDSLNDV